MSDAQIIPQSRHYSTRPRQAPAQLEDVNPLQQGWQAQLGTISAIFGNLRHVSCHRGRRSTLWHFPVSTDWFHPAASPDDKPSGYSHEVPPARDWTRWRKVRKKRFIPLPNEKPTASPGRLISDSTAKRQFYRRDRKVRGDMIMKRSALSAHALSLSKGSLRLVFAV